MEIRKTVCIATAFCTLTGLGLLSSSCEKNVITEDDGIISDELSTKMVAGFNGESVNGELLLMLSDEAFKIW